MGSFKDGYGVIWMRWLIFFFFFFLLLGLFGHFLVFNHKMCVNV